MIIGRNGLNTVVEEPVIEGIDRFPPRLDVTIGNWNVAEPVIEGIDT